MKNFILSILLLSSVITYSQYDPSQVLFVNPFGTIVGDSLFRFQIAGPNNPLVTLGFIDSSDNYVPQNGTFITRNLVGVKFKVISDNLWSSESTFKQPDDGVNITYTLPNATPSDESILTSTISGRLSWQNPIWKHSNNKTFLVDTSFSWFSVPSKYFDLHSTQDIHNGIRANLRIYDSILGLNIAHTFLGFGSLNSLYAGASSFVKYDSSCNCVIGGADFGIKNQTTNSSSHMKIGNNDSNYYLGRYAMIEHTSDETHQRAQYNFDFGGLNNIFNKSYPDYHQYYMKFINPEANGVLTLNPAGDTASFVVNETYGDTSFAISSLTDTIVIPHTLGEIPSAVFIDFPDAGSDLAVKLSKWYWDSSNITIILNGTSLLSNSRIIWNAKRKL